MDRAIWLWECLYCGGTYGCRFLAMTSVEYIEHINEHVRAYGRARAGSG